MRFKDVKKRDMLWLKHFMRPRLRRWFSDRLLYSLFGDIDGRENRMVCKMMQRNLQLSRVNLLDRCSKVAELVESVQSITSTEGWGVEDVADIIESAKNKKYSMAME